MTKKNIFFHVLYQQTQTTKSVCISTPEIIRLPLVLTLYQCHSLVIPTHCDYFLLCLASSAHGAHPCCRLSPTVQNVTHPWPHSFHSYWLRRFHLIIICPSKKHLGTHFSNRLHHLMWSETCCGLVGIPNLAFLSKCGRVNSITWQLFTTLTAITYSLPV